MIPKVTFTKFFAKILMKCQTTKEILKKRKEELSKIKDL